MANGTVSLRRHFLGTIGAGAAALPVAAQENNHWTRRVSPAVMTGVTSYGITVLNWLSTNHPTPLTGVPFGLFGSIAQIGLAHLREVGFGQHWDHHVTEWGGAPFDAAAHRRMLEGAGIKGWSDRRLGWFARAVPASNPAAHVKSFADMVSGVQRGFSVLYNGFNNAAARAGKVNHAAWHGRILRVGVAESDASDIEGLGGAIAGAGVIISGIEYSAGAAAVTVGGVPVAITLGVIGSILVVGGYLGNLILANSSNPSAEAGGCNSSTDSVACIPE